MLQHRLITGFGRVRAVAVCAVLFPFGVVFRGGWVWVAVCALVGCVLARELSAAEENPSGRVIVLSVGLGSPTTPEPAQAAEDFTAALRKLDVPETRLVVPEKPTADRRGLDPGEQGLDLLTVFRGVPRPDPKLGEHALVSVTAAVRAGDAALVPAGGKSAARQGVALESCIEHLIGKNQQGARLVVLLDVGLVGPERAATSAALHSALEKMVARWPNLSVWLVEQGDGRLARAFVRALGVAGSPYSLPVCLRALRRDSELIGSPPIIFGAVSPAQALDLRGLPRAEPPKYELIVRRGHADAVTALAVTADGRRVVSASKDSTVRLWNRDGRQLLNVLPQPINGVTFLALTPDERQIVYSDGLDGLWAWDVLSRAAIPARRVPAGRQVSRLGILADGSKVALLSDSLLYLWDLPPGDAYRPVAKDKKYEYLAVASRPGGAAFAACNRNLVTLFDAKGTAYPINGVAIGRITGLALSVDGTRLALGGQGAIARWLITSGANGLQASALPPVRVSGPVKRLLAFGPTGHLAAAVGDDVVLLNPADDQPRPLALLPDAGLNQVEALVFSEDGRWLCVVDGLAENPLLWELSAAGARPLRVAPSPSLRTTEKLVCAAFTPDGRLIAGDRVGDVREWLLPRPGNDSAAKPQDMGPTLDHSGGRVAHLDVKSVKGDEGYLLLQISSDEHEARFWDLRNRHDHVARPPLPGGQSWRNGALIPGRAQAVLVNEEGRLQVWDVEGKSIRTDFPLPTSKTGDEFAGRFDPLAVSQDGRFVAAGSIAVPHLVCIWDLSAEKTRLTHVIRGHSHQINALGFSRDNRFLVTASDEPTAQVWDLQNPARAADDVQILREPYSKVNTKEYVTAVVFLPDARDEPRFVTGGQNGRVQLWQVGQKFEEPLAILGDLKDRINTLSVSRSGKWLATATVTSKEPQLWDLFDEAHPTFRLRLPQPHSEQVTAIVPWPNGDLIATASLDATVRFWDLRAPEKPLLATLSTQSSTSAASSVESDWVAFTPDGLFDGSDVGRARVAWRMPGFQEVIPIDRFRRFFHHENLLRDLISPLLSYDVRVATASPTAGGLPTEGKNLVAVAPEDEGVHVRIFDRDGKRVVDVTKRPSANRSSLLETLRSHGTNSGSGRQLTLREKDSIVLEAASLVNYTPSRAKPVNAVIGQLPPPLIEIVGPSASEVDEPVVTLKVILTDQGGGFGSKPLNGKLGGQPLGALKRPEIAGDRRTYTVPVDLKDGENTFAFWSLNGEENRRSDEKIFKLFHKPAMPALAAQPERPRRRLFVLAVGVRAYKNETYNLNYPDKDATDIAQAFADLSQPPLFDDRPKIVRILNGDATKERILENLETLAKLTTVHDTLVLFFAGHGGLIKNTYHFFSYNMRDGDDEDSGISIEQLSAKLGRDVCAAERRLLILDTCASGGALQQRSAAERGRDNGLLTIVASSAEGLAHESKKIKHGLLTYSLLAALGRVERDEKDRNSIEPYTTEGPIRAVSWFHYAADKIRDNSSNCETVFGTKESQAPEIDGDKEKVFQDLVLFQLKK